MDIKKYFFCVFFLLIVIDAKAQFTISGAEPSSVNWNYIETPIYKVIYPKGIDSLARVYARNLELVSESISFSEGYNVNEEFTSKWPVVLHPYSSNFESSVSWPAHKADIYTTPNPYSPMSLSWERVMAINETRRISQIQFAYDYPFQIGRFLFGEVSLLALTSLFGGVCFHEGDALLAKTALTESGEGRSADFLEHIRTLYTHDAYYCSNKLSYGSIKDYVPTKHQVDYLYYSGIRAYYDVFDYNKQYYDLIKKKSGFVVFIEDVIAEEISGEYYEDQHENISRQLSKEWKQNDSLRAPFMSYTKLFPIKGLYTDFSKLQVADANIFAVRWGLTRPYELVKYTPDGKIHLISEFSEKASKIRYSPFTKKLYWSEIIPDIRWEQVQNSDIKYLDEKNIVRSFTKGQRYCNPIPHEDKLIVIKYLAEGGSQIHILDINTAEVLKIIDAPSGIQLVEAIICNGELYASGINLDGFSIYKVEPNFTALFKPAHTKIKDLWVNNDKLMFTCDKTSVNELYSLDLSNNTLLQLTNTAQGASDFAIKGNELIFSSLEQTGRYICSIPIDELQPKISSFEDITEFPMAEKIGLHEDIKIVEDKEVSISEPKSYNKFSNFIKLHSWLPFYLNYDELENISFDEIFNDIGLGATLFSQNDLGTSYGYAAYHAINQKPHWRHSAELSYTYSGLYPVLEAKIKFNERSKMLYGNILGSSEDPHFNARIRTYIPFNFSRGGWEQGLIPSFSYDFTNDQYFDANNSYRMNYMNIGLRAYTIEATPYARTFPRLGFGANLVYHLYNASRSNLQPSYTANVYAYLPGISELQGMKLSAYHQKIGTTLNNENISDIIPRGSEIGIAYQLVNDCNNANKFSFDYSIPFAAVDWSIIWGMFFIRNFELMPHCDYCLYSTVNKQNTNFWSAGADLYMVLYDGIKIGVSYNYMGGKLATQILDNQNSIEFALSLEL